MNKIAVFAICTAALITAGVGVYTKYKIFYSEIEKKFQIKNKH
jgi:hypothetical protein